MPSQRQNPKMPQVVEAETLVQKALDAYYELINLTRSDDDLSSLLAKLQEAYESTDQGMENNLATPTMPLELLAQLGIQWEQLEQRYETIKRTDATAIKKLLIDIEKFAFSFDALYRDCLRQKLYWSDGVQKIRRQQIKQFIGPKNQPGWELSTLLKAQRAVIDPYFEAIKQASIPDYLEAGRLLNQAWGTYQEYLALRREQNDYIAEISQKPDFIKAKQQLEEIQENIDDALIEAESPILEVIQAFQKKHQDCQDDLDHFLDNQKRTILRGEELETAARPACLAEIDALAQACSNLSADGKQRNLVSVGNACQQIKSQIELVINQKAELFSQLQSAFEEANQAQSKLDGCGYNRKQVREAWKSLERYETKMLEYRNDNDQHIKQLEKYKNSLEKVTNIEEQRKIAEQFKKTTRVAIDPLNREVNRLKNQLDSLFRSANEKYETQLQKLQQTQQEINALKAKLDLRLSWYNQNNPPIPAEFIQAKTTLLAEIMALSDVENSDAHNKVIAKLRDLETGGINAEFPKEAEAIAIFTKSLGAVGSWSNTFSSLWNSDTTKMNEEATKLAKNVQTVDIPALRSLLATAALDIRTKYPKWQVALEEEVQKLENSIKASGPQTDDAKNSEKQITDNISDSRNLALEITALQEDLTEQKNLLNIRLNGQRRSAQGILIRSLKMAASAFFGSEEFSGDLEKKRSQLVDEAVKIDSFLSAQEFKTKIRALIDQYKAILQDQSSDHLIILEDQAQAEKADEAKQKVINADEWRMLTTAYQDKLFDAQAANAPEDELTSIATVFKQINQTYIDDFAAAKTTLQALMRRLDNAMQRPEDKYENVRTALMKLNHTWKRDVSTFQTSVNGLFDKLRDTDNPQERESGIRAEQKLAPIRDYFDTAAFEKEIFLITTQHAVDDNQRQEARQRALVTLRSYRRLLEGSPLIRITFSNPFAPLAIGQLMDTLNKLEFNLVQKV